MRNYEKKTKGGNSNTRKNIDGIWNELKEGKPRNGNNDEEKNGGGEIGGRSED